MEEIPLCEVLYDCFREKVEMQKIFLHLFYFREQNAACLALAKVPCLQPTKGWLEHIGDCREGEIPRSLLACCGVFHLYRSVQKNMHVMRVALHVDCAVSRGR